MNAGHSFSYDQSQLKMATGMVEAAVGRPFVDLLNEFLTQLQMFNRYDVKIKKDRCFSVSIYILV